MSITHSRWLAFIFLATFLVYVGLLSAAENVWFSPCSGSDGLSFDSSFEDGVSILDSSDGKNATISAMSASKCSENAKSIKSGIRFGKLSIQYEGGGQGERLAEITSDPLNHLNNVLLFGIQKPNVMGKRGYPVKGRVQMNLYGNKGLKHLKMSARLLIPAELQLLNDYPERIDWLTISEWWNNAPWTKDLFPFRITVNLYKEPGKSPLLLQAHAQTYTSSTKIWNQDVWEYVNRDFNIPYGKWMTLEYEFIEGDKNQGRFYLAVTPDGDKRTVVFDVHNYTYHPEDPNPDGLSHLNPLKLYTSVKVINYLNSQGSSLRLYWDDLSLQGIPN